MKTINFFLISIIILLISIDLTLSLKKKNQRNKENESESQLSLRSRVGATDGQVVNEDSPQQDRDPLRHRRVRRKGLSQRKKGNHTSATFEKKKQQGQKHHEEVTDFKKSNKVKRLKGQDNNDIRLRTLLQSKNKLPGSLSSDKTMVRLQQGLNPTGERCLPIACSWTCLVCIKEGDRTNGPKTGEVVIVVIDKKEDRFRKNGKRIVPGEQDLVLGQTRSLQVYSDRVYENTTVVFALAKNDQGRNNILRYRNKNKPKRVDISEMNDTNVEVETRPIPIIRPTALSVSSTDLLAIPLSEWRSLERLKYHWENTAHPLSDESKKFVFWLERDADYQRHDSCITPDNKIGHCHYVQHCPLPDVIRDFDKFLSFACFVRNRYVGICCPDDYLSRDDMQSNSTQSSGQPTLHIPTLGSNPYEGSDYQNGVCGVSENTRIIGGAVASPMEWLWMAALILKSEDTPYCGGALITNQHILTAAHCLHELTPNQITVRLGAYDFSPSADPEAQDFGVEYFKIHTNYSRVTNENDLAIIKLNSKTTFTESIRPICLPQRNRDYSGRLAVVTGWGHTSFEGESSNQLRQVSLPVWNNTACDSRYSIAITENMLCAGNKQGGKDSCQGDSGGPLMLQGPNKRWMIIGVVSFGVKCGTPNYPGVYTRISEYIDWIVNNSKDIYK